MMAMFRDLRLAVRLAVRRPLLSGAIIATAGSDTRCLAGCYIPALRASPTDPVAALRDE
jgi:ABC-type lipoprotein release transport system permease subunit